MIKFVKNLKFKINFCKENLKLKEIMHAELLGGYNYLKSVETGC